MTEVHLSSHTEDFDTPAWRELLAADRERGLFSGAEWHRVWWDEFQAGKEPFVLTFRRAGRPIGIVPLYRKQEGSRRVLRFIGGIDLTDYLGPIGPAAEHTEIARRLVDWLRTTDLAWDEFDAHNLPVPGGFAEPFVEAVDRIGLAYRLEQEETSAILALPQDFDSYLAGLSSKDRHELKRKRRRIAREHDDVRVRAATEETLDVDLKTFVAMHRGAEGHKGHFMKPEIASFFERIAATFFPLGCLRLHFLEVEGIPIATTFGFELGRTVYLYNSAYEPDYRHLSPGFVLVAGLIEDAIERGLDRFDFLRGPERYKYQLGAEAVPLNNVRVLAEGKLF